MTTSPVLHRLALPLAVHLVAASALVARVQPALDREVERLGTLRSGVPALVVLLAFLPATVPAALGTLAAPMVRRSTVGLWWFTAGLWLTVGDTVMRSAVAWLLPPASGLGELFQRVALAPDAIGRLLFQVSPAAARAVGAVAAIGVTHLMAAACFGIAVAVARHGPTSDDPLPWPAGRGVVAGLAGAIVLAVGVRAASTPAVSAWLSVLA
ncbi:MAG: hypothetical protein MUF53_09230 [Gemmatimonadaceae bacterium]|jgi:hypothetical protein|nr:hypothetical protein [Gemmatimonadaceae bacterium]